MAALLILAALLLFSRWAYLRAERARKRDIAVQVDRAILLSLLGEVCGQRDAVQAKLRQALDLASESNRLHSLRELQKQIRDLHHVDLN